MESLTFLSQSISKTSSPEDSLLLGEKQAQLASAFESLQRSCLGRRRILEDGLVQAKDFASSWSEAMNEIEEKAAELDQLEVVGVDIDTVKTQLEEYKVYISRLTYTVCTDIQGSLRIKDTWDQLFGPL